MNIKYHQYGTGSEYGADGQLTNNWNPDADYGNEYSDVYFNIETKGYCYPDYCFTDEDREAFGRDIAEVFTALGWECKSKACYGSCSEWYKGKSHLYMHPQQFSGEVLKNEIKAVAEALMGRKSFKLRWVDLHATVYDITNDEYEEILTAKDEEIKSVILKACKTSRTNRFVAVNDVVCCVSPIVRIRRIGQHNNTPVWAGQTGRHVRGVISSLIADRYIVTPNDSTEYIRAINKTEQKKLKLFID